MYQALSFDPVDPVIFPTSTAEARYVAAGNPSLYAPFPGRVFQPQDTEYVFLRPNLADYASGNLTLILDWYSTLGAVTGSVTWTASMFAVSSGDAASVETKTFATSQSVTTAANTTAKGEKQSALTITNLDSLAAGDYVVIRLSRSSTDSMAGSALLVRAGLIYNGSGLPSLNADVTYYINSSTGNDTTGDGSVGLPWQTYARGVAERQKYGDLNAKFRLNLQGTGPYTMVPMGASTCGAGGYFIVAGDTETSVATGSFTGNINTTTNVIGCNSGVMGSDTKKGMFLRVTSGNLNSAVFQSVFHSDTNITLNNNSAFAALGAVASGNTFKVFTPGTQMSLSVTAGQPLVGPTDWVGGAVSQSNQNNTPQHIFYNLCFTGAFSCINSVVGLSQCWLSSGTQKLLSSQVSAGLVVNGSLLGVGGNSATYMLFAAGVYCASATGFEIDDGSTVNGCFYTPSGAPITVGSVSSNNALTSQGCRVEGTITAGTNGSFRHEVAQGACRFNGQLSALRGGKIRLASASPIIFDVTSGSCLRASYGGQIYMEGTAISGSTTGAGGFGSDASGGGFISWTSQTPTLTGVNAAADLKIGSLPTAMANATLATNGQGLTSAGSVGLRWQRCDFDFVDPSASNAAQLYTNPAAVGTNPSLFGRTFAAGVLQIAYFRPVFPDYVGGDLSVKVYWYSQTGAVTGAVSWAADFAAVTPGDAVSLLAKSVRLGSLYTTTVTTQAYGLNVTTIPVTGSLLDSLAAGDIVFMNLSRIPNAADTMAGGAVAFAPEISYIGGSLTSTQDAIVRVA